MMGKKGCYNGERTSSLSNCKNTAGIGARILALFNRRGFNVTKMTSGITNKPGYARNPHR